MKSNAFGSAFKDHFLIFLILLLAFALRFAGVQFGLPFLYHADEPIVVNHALAYGTGDLNPHFFKIPPLLSYLLFGVYGIFFLIGRVSGIFKSTIDFEHLFLTDPTSFYLSGRILFGALLGTLTIFVFFRLISKFFSEEKGLCSALLLSVCFLHVRDSHYIYPDILLLLVIILNFFIILNISQKNGLKDHILAGCLIGLSAAVKYNGAALVIPYIFSAFVGPDRSKAVFRCLYAGFFSAIIFFILNPFSIFDFHFFLREIRSESHAHGPVGWLHHLQYSLAGGISMPVLLVAVLGILYSFISKDLKKIIFSVFILSYYAIISRAGQPYDRYVLPLVPFLIFFTTDFLFFLYEKSGGRWIFFAAIPLFVFPSLAKSILFDRIMAAKDVRTLAKEWVETNISPGSHVALGWDFYLPRLRFSRNQMEKKKEESVLSHFSGFQQRRIDDLLEQSEHKPSYNLYFLSEHPETSDRFLFAKPLLPFDFNRLKDYGIDYVLVAQAHQKMFPENFFQDLESKATLVKEFNPYRDALRKWPYDNQPLTGGPFLWEELVQRERNGLPIKIYRIR